MKEYWYIPCNIRFCNVIDIIEKAGEVVWRRGASVCKGDIAYIYIGAPISAVKYKCEVIDESVSKELLEKNEYAKRKDDKPSQKYMLLKMLKRYEDDELPLTLLKENGLSQVQRQARNSRKLQKFLNEHDGIFNETE